MSNALIQVQAQGQGPPGFQNFTQPTSSNPTLGECVDNSSLNAHNANFPPAPDFGALELISNGFFHADKPKAQKDGPSPQVGHFCRLPNGQMEWVHNLYFSRGEEYQADVDMTTPLPQDSMSNVANESSSTSRRSMIANMFKKRMQTLRKNRTRNGNKEAPRIYFDPTLVNYLPDSMESIQAYAEKWHEWMVPSMSSVLTRKSPNPQPNHPRLVQQIPATLLQYQKNAKSGIVEG